MAQAMYFVSLVTCFNLHALFAYLITTNYYAVSCMCVNSSLSLGLSLCTFTQEIYEMRRTTVDLLYLKYLRRQC